MIKNNYQSAPVADSAPARPVTQLPITGERTVPGIAAQNYWFLST